MHSSGVFGDGLMVFPVTGSCRFSEFRQFPFCGEPRFCFSGGFLKNGPSVRGLKHGCKLANLRVRRGINASGETSTPIGPLQFESPIGQFLAQILRTHPHLLPAAVDQQLERLQSDRESQKEEKSPSATDLLSRRIAEVKDKERQRALEEIIYALIVQKFMDVGVSMFPNIPTPSYSWPNQESKLQTIHSNEAFEMIENHLALVLGGRWPNPTQPRIEISKLRIGKLYAASIMYGYFLRRVDQRFQLERSMGTLSLEVEEDESDQVTEGEFFDAEFLVTESDSDDPKSYLLRSYVMHLDSESLQRYATIRSKEAVSVIEKQTQALFGRPDIRMAEDGSLDALNDEVIAVSFESLNALVLEAVAFGSFLWDVEGYADSKYHFLTN
ncbi:hypothetical protein AMTRI_Chr03g145370 [Amborella trichopoda]